MREHLFLSHANPEDDEFTLWIALQLARDGYGVWCDLADLLGGEDFWGDAEAQIRQGTAKFLYLLSKSSNRKRGPNSELAVALQTATKNQLSDFVIPLRIDDLSYADMNIEIARLNAIDFFASRADGLKKLILKLTKDAVPKPHGQGANFVASWWNTRFNQASALRTESQQYLSNWFEVVELPDSINFHEVRRSSPGLLSFHGVRFDFPARQHGAFLVSFALASELQPSLPDIFRIVRTERIATTSLLDGLGPWTGGRVREARDLLSDLLRWGWSGEMESRGLGLYQLSDRTMTTFFKRGLVGASDRIPFPGLVNPVDHRSVVGYRTMITGRKRYWNFAIDAKPLFHPVVAYSVRPHVVFSDDGDVVWASKGRLHAARRSQCKEWWNDAWRDRILASMHWLAADDGVIRLRLGGPERVGVSSRPVSFSSPVTYDDTRATVNDQAADSFDFDSDEDAIEDLDE